MEDPKYLRAAFKALQTGDHSIPLEYDPPNCMYHFNVESVWDEWENDKYKSEWADSAAEWHKDLNKARHILKIKSMREKNPNWCHKSEANREKRLARKEYKY